MSSRGTSPSYDWSSEDESVFSRKQPGAKGKRPENVIETKNEPQDIGTGRNVAHDYYYGKREDKEDDKFAGEAPIYPEEPLLDEVEPIMAEKRHFCDDLFIYVLLGYLTGIFLVLFWYFRHYSEECDDLNMKWLIAVLMGLFLLIIVHSPKVRCVFLLSLPTMGSFRGWTVVTCIVLFVVAIGPLLNILRNIEIMAYSMSCEQTLLRNALTPMHEIMGTPVYVVEHTVYICLSQVRKLMENLDEVLQRLEAHIRQLHVGFTTCDMWLQHQQNFFESQMGSPYDRCLGAGRVCVQECEDKFKVKPSVCQHEKRFEWFCSNLKDLPSFFEGHLKEEQQMVDEIFTRPLDSFAKIRAMFEVSITFDHNPKSGENYDALNRDVDQHIAKELELQTRHFRSLDIFVHVILYVLILSIIRSTIYFRLNYLGSVNFSNFYVTNDFYKIDVSLEKFYGRRVLPLRNVEKQKYVRLGSRRMMPMEQQFTWRSVYFIIVIGLQLFTICFVDYSLFWMLAIMSNHSQQTAELQPPEYTKINIVRGGMIGDIMRGLIVAFEPLSKNLIVDIQRCLPLPRPPKFFRYWEIGMLWIVACILIASKAFLTRLCHTIMIITYPYYAHTRAMYFHHCMQLRRDVFIKSARRRARSLNNYYYANRLSHFLTNVRAKLYWITNGCLGTYMGQYCIICEAGLTSKDYIKCPTPECRGVYCQTCYMESEGICNLCTSRMKYGDVSDFTDVEDSSDDGESVKPKGKTSEKYGRQKESKTN